VPPGDKEIIHSILRVAPHLHKLTSYQDGGAAQPWGRALGSTLSISFEELACFSGPSLYELWGINMQSPDLESNAQEALSPQVFQHFSKLRILEWICDRVFQTELEQIPTTALSSLEKLCVSSNHDSFVSVLSHMELPSLRRLMFAGFFASGLQLLLTRHGAKLEELELEKDSMRRDTLDKCPRLKKLFICGASGMEGKLFTCKYKHTSLMYIHIGSISRRHNEKRWKSFFTYFAFDEFPALTEIQIEGITWPTNEHEISKSLWVGWSESLMKRGIKLTDKSGRAWRPRLKNRTR